MNNQLLSNELYAGVSSYGFGGTNSHVIIKSYVNKKNKIRTHINYNKKKFAWNNKIDNKIDNKVDDDSGFKFELN
jgi:hypothetical protein